jgi:threonine/homoserine/homoserine lactone efflux protein
MFSYLLQGLALGFPAAAQPGPLQAYLLAQALQNGWRRTLPAALAPLVSDGPIIFLVVLILTQLPPLALTGMRLVGGLFILYLAMLAVRGVRQMGDLDPEMGVPSAAPVARQSVWQAAVMNLLNPNPYIFWGTVGGPILLAGWAQGVASAVLFLVGMYIMLVGGLALLIYFFGTVGALSGQARWWLGALSAVALLLFGGGQIVWAVWELWLYL